MPAGPGAGPGAVTLRALTVQDWPAVRGIYAEAIAAGRATFERRPPDWETFNSTHLTEHRILACAGEETVGWAAAAPTSTRAVYRGVVEHSVYVCPAAQGRGVGRQLLRALVSSTEKAGIWTLQCSIFPENTASLALHRAEGFRVVGRRERIAKMTHGPQTGQWRDTLLLERRSGSAGADAG
ncbi:N-acetyltransferase family protein [Arthrobacter sp. zg-Y40]|uniref:GNAT family N-acetyltransferase n=1 Tax=Arthrobacter sp. zg-Y40 TaxID=2886939 RepID=UPI001D1448CF|nr:GNAT family N-acetyltransferase [Arthrobacter sp. zg-Y40]MCC3278051.1 N-acetyltransferase family protein [Arthrobacter sp. zg-Y40]